MKLNSSLKCSGWHMSNRTHKFTATYTFIHQWNEPSCLYFQPQSWLVTYHGGMPTWRRSPIPVQNDWQCGSRGSNSRPLSRKSDAITTRLPSHRTSPYSFSIPLRVEGWVGLCGWLHIKTVCPCMVTHPSASRIQCRVTLLMSSKPVVPC